MGTSENTMTYDLLKAKVYWVWIYQPANSHALRLGFTHDGVRDRVRVVIRGAQSNVIQWKSNWQYRKKNVDAAYDSVAYDSVRTWLL